MEANTNSLANLGQLRREMEQETIIQREARAEAQAAIVLVVQTYAELFDSEWVNFSRKVSSQFANWMKSELAPNPEEFGMCVNVPRIFESFEDYVLSKASNPAKVREWENAFANPDFRLSVTKFLYQKVFECKNERSLSSGINYFLTPIAYENHLRQHLDKNKRSFLHEAINKARKMSEEGLPQEDVIGSMVEWMDGKFAELESKVISSLRQNHFPEAISAEPLRSLV